MRSCFAMQGKWGIDMPLFALIKFFESLSIRKLVIKMFFYSSLTCGTAFAGTSSLTVANNFVAALQSSDVEKIESLESKSLKAQLSAKNMLNLWLDLERRLGPYKECKPQRIDEKVPYEVVVLICSFGSNKVDLGVSVKDDLVFGVFILKTYGESFKSAAEEDILEKDIVFGEMDWQLPATLTLPKSRRPFAAAVFVHGSGPLDRNESVGQTHLFKDLSSRLAKQGIASLRYDKRTFHFAVRMAANSDVTIEEETVDDARLALSEIRKQLPDVSCIYLIGHSLGAYLAPTIVQGIRPPQGLVLMAPPGRPMVDVMLDQVGFLRSISRENEAALKKMHDDLISLKELPHFSSSKVPGFWGTSAWRFFQTYNPLKQWEKMDVSTLVLFAEKDYQVTGKDALIWGSLEKWYPTKIKILNLAGLGHAFSPVAGSPSPENYLHSSEVSNDVVHAITDFMSSKCPH